jgi:hypothetical protein
VAAAPESRGNWGWLLLAVLCVGGAMLAHAHKGNAEKDKIGQLLEKAANWNLAEGSLHNLLKDREDRKLAATRTGILGRWIQHRETSITTFQLDPKLADLVERKVTDPCVLKFANDRLTVTKSLSGQQATYAYEVTDRGLIVRDPEHRNQQQFPAPGGFLETDGAVHFHLRLTGDDLQLFGVFGIRNHRISLAPDVPDVGASRDLPARSKARSFAERISGRYQRLQADK